MHEREVAVRKDSPHPQRDRCEVDSLIRIGGPGPGGCRQEWSGAKDERNGGNGSDDGGHYVRVRGALRFSRAEPQKRNITLRRPRMSEFDDVAVDQHIAGSMRQYVPSFPYELVGCAPVRPLAIEVRRDRDRRQRVSSVIRRRAGVRRLHTVSSQSSLRCDAMLATARPGLPCGLLSERAPAKGPCRLQFPRQGRPYPARHFSDVCPRVPPGLPSRIESGILGRYAPCPEPSVDTCGARTSRPEAWRPSA